jgi:lipoate-protein ligase A
VNHKESMRLVDFSFRSPTQNLAYDEVLLNRAESGKAGEVLRFWESETPFVVVGVAQVLRREVFEKNCADDHVRILRRASAGGCVLQGPGCLNYALVLSHDRRPEIATIRGSYCYILDRICEALRRRGITAHHKGTSDLAAGGKKISGSAQKRRRRCILHHGTLLYEVDIERMERYLREPADRPQYRGARTHRGFIRAIPLTPRELRECVCEAFGIEFRPQWPSEREIEATRELAREQYASMEWIRRR